MLEGGPVRFKRGDIGFDDSPGVVVCVEGASDRGDTMADIGDDRPDVWFEVVSDKAPRREIGSCGAVMRRPIDG